MEIILILILLIVIVYLKYQEVSFSDDLPHNIYDPKNNTATNMKDYWDKKWVEHNKLKDK